MWNVREIADINGTSSPSVKGIIVQKLAPTTGDDGREQLDLIVSDCDNSAIKAIVQCFGSFASTNQTKFQPYDTIDIHPSYIKWEMDGRQQKTYILVLDDSYNTTYPDGGKVGLFLLSRIDITPGINEMYSSVPLNQLNTHLNKKDVSIVGLVTRIGDVKMIKTKKGRGVEKQDITLSNKGDTVVLSCWGDKGSVARSLRSNTDILFVTNVSVQTFAGRIQCNTTFNSILTVNPTGYSITNFIDVLNPHAATPVKATSSEGNTAQLTSISGINQFLLPRLSQSNSPEGAFVACLMDVDLSSPFFARCPSCKKTVPCNFDESEWEGVDCTDCGVPAAWQYKVNVTFIDGSGSLRTILWGETATQFVGFTATQFNAFDRDKREEVRRAMLWKRYIVEHSVSMRGSGPSLRIRAISPMEGAAY